MAEADEIWFEILSEHRPAAKLMVRLRGVVDIQIEYHETQTRGCSFEMLLLGIATPTECPERAAQLVADLTDERLVIAYKRARSMEEGSLSGPAI